MLATSDSPSPTIGQAAALFHAGRVDEAAATCRHLIAAAPADAEALHLAGAIALRREEFAGAEAWIRRAIITGNASAAHFSNRGAAHRGLDRLDEAGRCYQRALALAPDWPEIAANIANLMKAAKHTQAAARWYTRAIRLRPDWPKMHGSLGVLLLEQRRYQEAMAALERTIALCGPDVDDAVLNLGMVRQKVGDLRGAERAYGRILARTPEHPSARWNRALVWLVQGRMPDGWREYRWRWKLKGNEPSDHPQPRWTGQPLDGRRIFIQAEQGLGDTLQFARFLPMVAARGGRVVLECQAPLVQLLAHSFPGMDIVPQGAPPPDFDTHIPLLDLPAVFGTRLEDIPAGASYLRAPPPRAGLPMPEQANSVRRIGVVWGGEPAHLSDAVRSMRLDTLATLFGLPGVRFYSLQKGARAAEAADWVARGLLTDAGRDFHDFADTAAFVAQLDLVITVDTSVAHLAGALGIPVWIMVAASPDWRWLLDRQDSPWYPSARLFRSAFDESWSHVIARVAYALGTTADTPFRSL